MPLDSQKYREAVVRMASESTIFVEAPEDYRNWVAAKRLPSDVAEFLLTNTLAKNVSFPTGCGGVWHAPFVMHFNDTDAILLHEGLLAVGSAINGDRIVIDCVDKKRRTGFVDHESLWGCQPATVRSIFVPIADSIDEMLSGITKELNIERGHSEYPIDYCDALDHGFIPDDLRSA